VKKEHVKIYSTQWKKLTSLSNVLELPELSQKDGHPLHVSNFGLSEEATDLNIVITRKEKGEEREYQETFIFHQK
jgi:hypothetical protein